MATLPERPAKRVKSPKGEHTATHIPWQDIFKCHISVIEGHLRMLEMIQQYTTPQTENWNIIVPMVERAKEMLKHSKAAAALTIEGWDVTIGDGTNTKKDGGVRRAQESVSATTPSQGAKKPSSKKRPIADNSPDPASASVSKRAKKLRTRREDSDNGSTSVREKGDGNNSHKKPVVEFEDISAEVDAALREKEERRRRKAEKKRRRESGGSAVADAANENCESASPAVWAKTKKKVKKDTIAGTDVGSEAERKGKSGGSEKGKDKGKEKEKRGNEKRIDAEEEEDDTVVRTKRQKKD